jgi:hypothetical protein
MNIEELEALFQKHEDEYLKPNGVEGPADLAAFNRIHKLVPSDKDMISCAEHDEYWLSVSPADLAAVATEEDIIFLRRCGVMYDGDTESFSFFA